MEFAYPSELARQVFVYGSFQPNEFALIDRVLAPGMTLVDVGANSGSFTVAGARKVWPTGKVLAFEPSKREFQNLNRNIALNNFDNVVAMQCGVLDAERRTRFYVAGPEFSGLSSFAEIDAIDFKTLPNLRVAWSSVPEMEDQVSYCSLADREILIQGGERLCLELKIYSESDFIYNISSIDVKLSLLDRMLCLLRWLGGRLLTDEGFRQNAELMRRVKPLLISTKGDVTTQAVKKRNENYIRISACANCEINFRLRAIVRGAKQIVIRGEGEHLIEPESYEVDCVKLDDVCERLEVQRVDVVKIDVEGAEMAVLRGASSIIRKHRPLLIIELSDRHLVRQGSSVSDVVAFLQAERYQIVDVDGGQCAVVNIPLPREGDFVAVHEDKVDELRRVLMSPQSS